MEYQLHTNYKHQEFLRNAFFDFTEKVFGISFREWYEKGCWNDCYICYSLFDGDKLISNVSLSKLKVFINGQVKDAIQIATVGTLPKYQGKGLSRYLMEKVIADYEGQYELFYLSANDSVLDFYPRFGFRRVLEYRFYADLPVVKGQSGGRWLNLEDREDYLLLERICARRLPITTSFCPTDYQHIFMWYIFNFHKNKLWYIQDRDVIVVYEVKDQVVHIYDIVSEIEYEFVDLLGYFKVDDARKIRFHFTPDGLGLDVQSELIRENDPFFVRGEFNLAGKEFKFPQLAQT